MERKMDAEIKPRTQAETVKALIAQQFNYPGKIEGTQSLVDDLKGDSLDQFELVMTLEDEFRIEIRDADFMAWSTVQNIVDYIAARVTA